LTKPEAAKPVSESQRAMIGVKLATPKTPEPPARPAPISRPQAAVMVNASERGIASARVVIDKGTPELVEAVERSQRR
jgi:hypothetical protein